jgi:hypothetical protein
MDAGFSRVLKGSILMKRFLFKFVFIPVTIFLLTICSFNVGAETIYHYNELRYFRISDSTASLCGIDDGYTELNVPKDVSDYYIVEIAASSFSENKSIETINLSKATMLNKIGDYSFINCSNISGNIRFPYKLNELGVSAFQGCDSLETVNFSNSILTKIKAQAFYNCTKLNEVYLPSELLVIEKFAFANTGIKEITIPKSVTSINSTAFSGCDGLVIKGYRDSYAQQFAEDNGYEFEILDPLYGDANSDGILNILDVTAIQRYKIGEQDLSDYGMKCADVNHDGSVTIRDATLIQMKLARYDVDF